jgi:predicted metal-dependent HD superfamily phosphohydrolase
MNEARWKRLMSSLGIGDESETFNALMAACGESHRRYHTPEHVSSRACTRTHPGDASRDTGDDAGRESRRRASPRVVQDWF